MESVHGMPAEVWECVQARFPGLLRRDQSPDLNDQESATSSGAQRLAQALSRPSRLQHSGYEGGLVAAQNLLPILAFLRDDLGYTYLIDLTAADYPESPSPLPPHIDVVYYLCRIQSRGYITLHVHIARQHPRLPSISAEFPAAGLREREVWDMFGVRFEGHPDPRRLLLWEGFDGFPLRKDWHEPCYEGVHKPFRNRFPDGGIPASVAVRRSSPSVPEMSVGRAVDSDRGQTQRLLWDRMASADCTFQHHLAPDERLLEVSPRDFGAPGTLRLALRVAGETIQHVEPVVGCLHRGHEKFGERNTWLQNLAYADRLDPIDGSSTSLAYCSAVERLLGWEVPERAQYIRVIFSEFSRMLSHLWVVGLFGQELGLALPAASEVRGLILDLFERATGRRRLFNVMRPGGVAYDLPKDWVLRATELVVEGLPRAIRSVQRSLLDNEIVRARSVGVGVLSSEAAVAYGVSGPVLRACGISYDVRRAESYGVYGQFDFEVSTREEGDTFARISVRFDEIWQSLRILAQALNQLSSGKADGRIQACGLAPLMRIPSGETYSRIEAPQGELGCYLVSDGGANPYRYHVRTPSLSNLAPLSALARGARIADVPVILSSIAPTQGEVDR